jgi:GTPase SAR1 family protein
MALELITREEQISGDEFIFGRGHVNPNKILKWNPDNIKTMNPHGLICGISGAGKTTLLKQVVRYLQNHNKHIYLIDLQGDLGMDNENHIEFTAWDAKYGINPFEFDMGVSADVLKELIHQKNGEFGKYESQIKNAGPIVQVKVIVEIVRKNFFKNLGPNQDAILSKLFLDTYKLKGIVYDDYTTWLNDLPDINDTKELISEIENTWEQLQIDMKLDKVTLQTSKVIHETYAKLGDSYKAYWEEHGIDPLKYMEKKTFATVKGLQFHIDVLVDGGVFHSRVPPVKAGLNRLDLSGLSHEIQRVLSDIFIGKIFRACKLRGEYKQREDKSRGELCDTYIIVDEGKLIVPSGRAKNDPYSYLNRIITEARKYGLGLIIVVQSPQHLPDEFLRNVYLQVILTMNESDYESARKCFDLRDKELLKHTKTFGVGLVKDKVGFTSIRFPWYVGNAG